MEKINLLYISGGLAVEHLHSVRAMLYLASFTNRERYNIKFLYLDKNGDIAGKVSTREYYSSLLNNWEETWAIKPDGDFEDLLTIGTEYLDRDSGIKNLVNLFSHGKPDIAFPVFHGQKGEDGLFQGLLEILKVPYTGAGVSGSVVGNDKDFNSRVCSTYGVKVPDYLTINNIDWFKDSNLIIGSIEEKLKYPIFIKPCCLGSSMGISKVYNNNELVSAFDKGFTFGDKLILENHQNGREIGIGIIGNKDIKFSETVEFFSVNDFFDYDAKYGEKALPVKVPADISSNILKKLKEQSLKIYRALGLSGMARLDFFLDGEDLIYNECNTVPGFGVQSVFNLMWHKAGMDTSEFIDYLVNCSLEGEV